MPEPSLNVHIRWMIRRDMESVLEIEQGSFGQRWSEDEFLEALRQRNVIGMVAERDDRIVGFMIYELHKTHIYLLRLAVNPLFRRADVGEQMIAKLAGKLSAHGRTEVRLCVREGNLAAQLFLREQGFLAYDVIRDRFEDTGEAGYMMRLAHPDSLPVDADPTEIYSTGEAS